MNRMKSILSVALLSLAFVGSAERVAVADTAATMKQFERAGAKIVPMSRIPSTVRGLSNGTGGAAGSEWCVGAAACLDLIEKNVCKDLRCGNDHGTPVCWCDT